MITLCVCCVGISSGLKYSFLKVGKKEEDEEKKETTKTTLPQIPRSLEAQEAQKVVWSMSSLSKVTKQPMITREEEMLFGGLSTTLLKLQGRSFCESSLMLRLR